MRNFDFSKMISSFCVGLCFFALLSCDRRPREFSFAGETMGTTYRIVYMAKREQLDLPAKIERLLLAVNQIFSTYIDDSEISRINHLQQNLPFQMSEEFESVLVHALEVAKQTEGIFDPTIGPLVNLWGFGPSGERKVPSSAEVLAARELVGYQKLSIVGRELKKKSSGMYLDLSASAKGHGVDRVAQIMESEGVPNYLVEIGGEIKSAGTKNGAAWRVGIESPSPRDMGGPIYKIIHLKNGAMATSGNYRNFFEKNGRLYSHTIDSHSGEPAQDKLISVSVVDPASCKNADAWATALMAAGKSKGLELAEKFNLAAYFIYADVQGHHSIQSAAFSQFLEQRKK